MFDFTKKILSYSLMIISIITFIHITILSWMLIEVPLCSFTALRLMKLAFYGRGGCYLIPISISICLFMLIAALSVRKQKVILPVLLLPYLLYDSIFLIRMFIKYLYVYNDFMVLRLVQILINISIIVLMGIYFYHICKRKKCLTIRVERIENSTEL